jgi:prepilin-type N-terminal cleavage/methylation domain-containing protein
MNIKNKKGFTLIELLVVVAIISMLTSVTLSSLSDAKQKGRDAGKVRVLQEVRSALQLYATDNNGFPGTNTVAGLTAALVSGTKKYIQSIDTSIIYTGTNITNTAACTTGTCASYHLGIVLEGDSTKNRALSVDKDINVGFNGNTTDCATTVSSDRCYDIVP